MVGLGLVIAVGVGAATVQVQRLTASSIAVATEAWPTTGDLWGEERYAWSRQALLERLHARGCCCGSNQLKRCIKSHGFTR